MDADLGELADLLRQQGEQAFTERWSSHFFVSSPDSAFNISRGPKETMRVNREAFLASARGEFHSACPAFAVARSPSSAYSFVSVGRTENCDICLPDDTVSKLHALLRLTDEGWTVQDADSANGTTIGTQVVPTRSGGDPVLLTVGDEVSFGQVKLRFVDVPSLVAILEAMKA